MSEARVLHRGRVVFRNGAGAAAALVFVKTGTAPTPEIAIRCDAEGFFRIALPPGRFVLEGRAADGRVGQAEVNAGADPLTLEIAIPAE